MFNFIQDLLHIFYPRSFTLANGKKVRERFNAAPYITLLLVALIIYCMQLAGVDFSILRERGKNFWDMLGRMLPPNWKYYDTMKKPMLDTINMSLLGSVFGCAVALPVSFYLSSNFKLNKAYLATHRVLLSLLRTLPTMIIACYFRMVLGMGVFRDVLPRGVLRRARARPPLSRAALRRAAHCAVAVARGASRPVVDAVRRRRVERRKAPRGARSANTTSSR